MRMANGTDPPVLPAGLRLANPQESQDSLQYNDYKVLHRDFST